MKTRTKVLSMIAVAILLLNSNFSIAQDAKVCKPHDFTIGVLGGPNLSILYAGSEEMNKNYGFGVGYNVGLTTSYALNNHFSIAAQVNFAQLSSERKDMQPLLTNSPLQTTPYTLYANYQKIESYDYLEVPVMFRATVGNKVKFYVDGGAYIGFIANASVKSSGNSMLYKDLAGQIPNSYDNTVYSMDGKENTTSSVNTVSFGVTGGLGVGYTFGRHSLVFDTRYEIGLTNIRSNTILNGRNNLQTIMAGIGYNYVLFR